MSKEEKTTTTIEIDDGVLAEFSYLVSRLEKPKKRNQILEDMMKAYISEKKPQLG